MAEATHRMSKLPEYDCWVQMRARCNNPKHKHYAMYGGRGIEICGRWVDFEKFYQDMGPRPTSKHSLDRIDNNGNYEPENCRWATSLQQMRNRRFCRHLTFEGQTLCVSDWAERLGINQRCIYKRLDDGWSVERTLSTPVRLKRRSKT